jgi:hypothetical protein
MLVDQTVVRQRAKRRRASVRVIAEWSAMTNFYVGAMSDTATAMKKTNVNASAEYQAVYPSFAKQR